MGLNSGFKGLINPEYRLQLTAHINKYSCYMFRHIKAIFRENLITREHTYHKSTWVAHYKVSINTHHTDVFPFDGRCQQWHRCWQTYDDHAQECKTCIVIDMYMSYSWVSFWWKVTWQRNSEWRHSVRRPCDTMRIRRRIYRNTIMLIRLSVLYGTMYRVASICFCIFERCTSRRTMYMTYYTTYTWIRHDSVKGEYDISSSVSGFPLLVSFHQYSILIHASIISAV